MALAIHVGDGVAAVDRIGRATAFRAFTSQPAFPLLSLHNVRPSRTAPIVVDDGASAGTGVVLNVEGGVLVAAAAFEDAGVSESASRRIAPPVQVTAFGDGGQADLRGFLDAADRVPPGVVRVVLGERGGEGGGDEG